ncbi:GNAT family N-acetyltransferase [Trinickia violacea]|uniref:GNAT family N-acetyltransferase n=1 Tax=Trinickia violacea TaxID=2571746 RepID=A0A4P8IWS5_9BURK|nr:GNAT family N-acetyltransferase [Trinickia violacea]
MPRIRTCGGPAAIRHELACTPRAAPGSARRPQPRAQHLNDAKIMRYWFEEPYETFSELSQLYDQHVHDQRERRFVVIDAAGETVGLVELIELDYIHRRGEFQIIIASSAQGRGYATIATRLAVDYAAAFFHAAANTAAQISNVPPPRFTARCTLVLRIARRALDASNA